MSGDFRSFREIEHLREWFTVHPGDSSPKDQADDEQTRAYNHSWSIRLPWADIEGREV